jgi:flagellar protein FlaG
MADHRTEMSLQIGRFTPYENLATGALGHAVAPSPAHQQAGATAVQARPVDAIVGDIPPVPTPEVRAEVDRAAERVDELRAQGRELHFSKDPASNRVIIEVRDLEGNVLKTIPPSKALHVMAGGEL